MSKDFPKYKKGEFITEKVKSGIVSLSESKPVIINPNTVEVRFSVGAHFHSKASGCVLPSPFAEIKLLHYKQLGKDYVKERYEQLSTRSSCTNKDNEFGEHWYSKRCHSDMPDHFDKRYKDIQVVIDTEKVKLGYYIC
jgi:hypothetical protein